LLYAVPVIAFVIAWAWLEEIPSASALLVECSRLALWWLRCTHFMAIVREVLLSDGDFLGLLYLRDVIKHDRV
jgi:hypothetical protein